jgi:hypothetical protein
MIRFDFPNHARHKLRQGGRPFCRLLLSTNSTSWIYMFTLYILCDPLLSEASIVYLFWLGEQMNWIWATNWLQGSTLVTYLVNPPTSTSSYLGTYLCQWVVGIIG